MTVRIVTDSACDLDESLTAERGIEVVPLSIRFGSDEFVDRQDISAMDFYRLMDERDELPETAAPSPGAFEQAFRKLADEGASGIVCVNLSAALSATMQAAQNAAEAVADDIDVRVVDSRSITCGLGTLVLTAADLADAGERIDTIVSKIDELSDRTRVYGVLDTLENLKKGGRIGGAKALVGTMLSIKPLLDLSSGVTEEAGRQRTRKKAFGWLRDKIVESGPVESLSVMHGNAPDIDDFLAMLEPHVDVAAIRVGMIGPVIGAHGGPRVVGVSFLVPPGA